MSSAVFLLVFFSGAFAGFVGSIGFWSWYNAPERDRLPPLKLLGWEYKNKTFILDLQNGPQRFKVRGAHTVWYHLDDDGSIGRCSSRFEARLAEIDQRIRWDAQIDRTVKCKMDAGQ